MVVRTKGMKKAKESGRRFFQFGAIGGVVSPQTGVVGYKSAPNGRFGSLSLPSPWKEDARIDDDGSERWLEGNKAQRGQ